MELKKEQSNDNLKYDQLSIELQERIKDDRKQGKVNPYRCNDDMVIRRNMNHDKPITIVMRIKRRCFHFTVMMILQEELCMFSLCQELREI